MNIERDYDAWFYYDQALGPASSFVQLLRTFFPLSEYSASNFIWIEWTLVIEIDSELAISMNSGLFVGCVKVVQGSLIQRRFWFHILDLLRRSLELSGAHQGPRCLFFQVLDILQIKAVTSVSQLQCDKNTASWRRKRTNSVFLKRSQYSLPIAESTILTH